MAASSASAQNGREARELLRLLLDAPQVAQYFHFKELPERLPLRVVNRTAADLGRPDFKIGGAAVEVVSGEAGARPVLEITQLDIERDRARLVFRYRVEGVAGEAVFRKTDDAWTLQGVAIDEQ
jgi:hypothetical protein